MTPRASAPHGNEFSVETQRHFRQDGRVEPARAGRVGPAQDEERVATRDQRRLSAIVSADVAGYSRLMGVDESGTLSALKAHRHELIDPKIAEYGGRVVKTSGDGLLLEFPSVVDAVRCSVDVQRGMHERNTSVPVERRIEFRIGINLGDIIIDGDDIFGDGVNVAARLQVLATPGSICVGRAVRDQVIDKLGFGFEALGPQALKNIARPVEVFRIRDEPGDGVAVRTGAASRRGLSTGARRVRYGLLAALIAVGIAGGAMWLIPHVQRTLSPPAAPFSVAVVPFSAVTASAGEVQFANALSENVMTTLGGFLFFSGHVASAQQVLGYKGRAIDAQRIGRELDVRYLVEGAVRESGRSIEVSAQVVDTGSGANLWSGRLKTDPSARTDASDVTARKLSNLVTVAIHANEVKRAAAHPIRGSKVDLVLEFEAAGRAAKTPQQRLANRKYLDEALRIDPDYIPAREYLAALLDDLAGNSSLDAASRARYRDEEDRLTLATVKIDETAPGAWSDRAQALIRLERFDQALEANGKAVAIVEARPDVAMLAQRAWILESMDRLDEALEVAQRASTLSPDAQTGQEGFAIRMVCSIQLLRGQYQDAIDACQKSAALENWWVDHMWLTAAYAQLGDSARASAEAAILRKLKPDLTIATLERNHVGNEANLRRVQSEIYAGLRKAGIPER